MQRCLCPPLASWPYPLGGLFETPIRLPSADHICLRLPEDHGIFQVPSLRRADRHSYQAFRNSRQNYNTIIHFRRTNAFVHLYRYLPSGSLPPH